MSAHSRPVDKAKPAAKKPKKKVKQVNGRSSGPVSSAFAHLVALDYAKQAGRGHLVAAGEFFD